MLVGILLWSIFGLNFFDREQELENPSVDLYETSSVSNTPDTPDTLDTPESPDQIISYDYNNLGYDYSYSDAVITEDIESLKIDWLNGNVCLYMLDDAYYNYQIVISDGLGSSVTLSEQIYYKITDGLLSIKFAEDGTSISESYSKELSVGISPELAGKMKSIEINGKAVNVDISNITVGDLKIEIVSGDITENKIVANMFEVDAEEAAVDLNEAMIVKPECENSSGDLNFRGFVDILGFESGCGDVRASFTASPSKLDAVDVIIYCVLAFLCYNCLRSQ